MIKWISSLRALPKTHFGNRAMISFWTRGSSRHLTAELPESTTVIGRRRTGWHRGFLFGSAAVGAICLSLLSPTGAQAQPPAPGFGDSFGSSLPWDSRRQYYEQLPADRGGVYEEMSPIDRFLYQVADNSWIQIDYMLWNLDQSNDEIIGESVLNEDKPDLGYLAFDRSSGSPPVNEIGATRLGYAPRLGLIDLNSMNGMRLKYGLETLEGTFEASAWWIFQTNRSGAAGPYVLRNNLLGGTAPTPTLDLDGVTAIPLLRNSAIANSALIFDTSYAVDYETSLFGTEFNYIWDDKRPKNGFHFKHMLGFRYMKLDEHMRQTGVDSDVTTDDNNNEVIYFRTATIDTDTINQMYGPQIGARLELVDNRFILGAQPAFTLAFNHIDAKLNTNALFTGDNPLTTADESTDPTAEKFSQDKLSPVLSLAMYTKIKLQENFYLYASWDVLYMDAIVRPGEAVVYDDDGDITPDLYLDPIETSALIQGLSVGAIFEF